MYVDKMLGGIQAVQTLSRLNGSYPGKDTTYILDFVNEAGEILKAFKTYYETAELEATTDPHLVYDLQAKLDATGNYDKFEVDRVAKLELDAEGTQTQLSAVLVPVAGRLLKRYKAAQQDKAAAEAQGDDKAAQAAKDVLDALILFKNDMGAYVRLYAFLSQISTTGTPTSKSASCSTSGLSPCCSSVVIQLAVMGCYRVINGRCNCVLSQNSPLDFLWEKDAKWSLTREHLATSQ